MQRRAVAALSLAAICTATLAASRADAAAAPADLLQAPVTVAGLPTVVWGAHRGGALEQPDGTLAAARAALAAPDVPVLDLDVRLLSDGTPVLMHDSTVDRTTTGTGSVSASRRPAGRAAHRPAVLVRPRPSWPRRYRRWLRCSTWSATGRCCSWS